MFMKKYGKLLDLLKDGFLNFDDFAKELSKKKTPILSVAEKAIDTLSGYEKYRVVHKLAWVVFAEQSNRAHGDGESLPINENDIAFQKYMYAWNRLYSKKIPFEEWTELADEGINILRDMIKNENWNYQNNPTYMKLIKDFAKKHEELRTDKEYSQLDSWLDD